MSIQANNALATFFNDVSLSQWTEPLAGPAIALPPKFKAFKLEGNLVVEFLDIDSDDQGTGEADEGTDLPNKNHVVFLVPFAQPYRVRVNGKLLPPIYGARVSMDTMERRESLVNSIAKDRLEHPYIEEAMFQDYHPGTLNIKLLEYKGKSKAARKVSIFSNLNKTTLGNFVDFIVNLGLHEMSFLGYGQAWKGCRHFIAQTYLQLRMLDAVSEKDKDEETLEECITKVYSKSGSRNKLIDRGRFLNYQPIYPDYFADAYELEVVETSGDESEDE